ncbi:NAD(P)-dependent dehydrogenase (short-subunit alcohol dehydrogenase family) [Psychrobacillus insolitus]|jgi:NAD(P)-dependent dehydrogenase (short-subunit alcohol dehydrogenase family)|uniref:NAD(P)-dependent dehydrogenase (Short-subunit alcohol dehydrogenase family) n=1 Tax=Psychrobacillus insolitus TaxID=1461 RepID=A0A2W7MG31_9BACI|nr:glucose 1-dehydrogenase [Psychrobacillus insolitus]PZX04553.1 NAD(P)-dependent dehydrogenase (short-subunit alcohol dehydrogenase family) [Psychrobacillus insolitus]
MGKLDGKVAIVTGGASGIGLATVKAFAEKGAKVVLADFNVEVGQAKADELKAEGLEVSFVQVDAGSEESVKNLVAKAVQLYGKLDVIVNNAGIGSLGEMHELSYDDYHKVIRVNQDGVFFGTKYAVQEFLKTGGGVVLNTSSILGLVAEAGAYPYVASKHAVVGMTKSAALQYAGRNIRVNAVSPGYVVSGMVNKEALGEFYDGLVAKHPIGRLGNPDEIAHAFVFLAENDFVTGTVVPVDGGYTAQ